MKRAHQYPEYRDAGAFPEPQGMLHAQIDPASGQLATPACPAARTELFIGGIEPKVNCQLHQATAQENHPKNIFKKLWGIFR